MSLNERLRAFRGFIPTMPQGRKIAGICLALSFSEQRLVRGLVDKWPKFSGNYRYPVPAPDPEAYGGDRTMAAWAAYRLSSDKWDEETQYGRDRRELLDWLIEQTELSNVITNPVD